MSNQPTLYPLNEYQLATVKGEDARDFLQGQLSNDINFLDQQAHQLSAYCTPKGRMLAIFNIVKLEDGYALIAPREIMAKVMPRLKMFVMRAKVNIELTEGISVFGLLDTSSKEKSTTLLQELGTSAFWQANDSNRAFVLANGESTSVLLGDNASFQLSDFNQWCTLDIESNIPQLFIENNEALIPQSVNLDLVDGVNFKKGCYPGQEIIARIKYRGKPKTRMIVGYVESDVAVEIGMPIYNNARDSSVGMVINLAKSGDKTLVNISVPVTHISEGDLFLNSNKTARIQRLILPYDIPV